MNAVRQRPAGLLRPRMLLSAKEGSRPFKGLRVVADADLAGIERPVTRGDCLPGGHNEARPCPFVSCSVHLALDTTPKGALYEVHPDVELEQLAATCALDVADAGMHGLDEIGAFTNVTRERIRQIEARALQKSRAAARKGEDGLDVIAWAADPRARPISAAYCRGCGAELARPKGLRAGSTQWCSGACRRSTLKRLARGHL